MFLDFVPSPVSVSLSLSPYFPLLFRSVIPISAIVRLGIGYSDRQLAPWRKVLLENPDIHSVSRPRIFPSYRIFITILTEAPHWTLF
jgi:hypothetical protein